MSDSRSLYDKSFEDLENESREIFSDFVVKLKYSRYNTTYGRRETWKEVVKRVLDMHRNKFKNNKKVLELIDKYECYVEQRKIMLSMRAYQFAGQAIERNNLRMYNCGYLPIDNILAFREIFFLLLGGTGMGFSVQNHHVNELPPINKLPWGKKLSEKIDNLGLYDFNDNLDSYKTESVKGDFVEFLKKNLLVTPPEENVNGQGTKVFLPSSQKELDDLKNEYYGKNPEGLTLTKMLPGEKPYSTIIETFNIPFDKMKEIISKSFNLEYENQYIYVVDDTIEGWSYAVDELFNSFLGKEKNLGRVIFDYSKLRCRGIPLKVSGGLAPGFLPLLKIIEDVDNILLNIKDGVKLRPIQVYDCLCYMALGVVAGGSRRSAQIAFFSFDDSEMMECKDQKVFNPDIGKNMQRCMTNNSAVLERDKINEVDFNKLFEAQEKGGYGEPGIYWTNDKNILANPCVEISLRPFQLCNLSSINASALKSKEEFYKICKIASFFSTIQASYTDFPFVREIWKKTTEEDALLGVSISGIQNSIMLNLTDDEIKKGAEIVVNSNKKFAKYIGINSSSRCTTIKPDGATSFVNQTSAGIHAIWAPFHIRRITLERDSVYAKFLLTNFPKLIELSERNSNEAYFLMPTKAYPNANIVSKQSAKEFLEIVKRFYHCWIEPGHVKGVNMNNISTTLPIKSKKEWIFARKWLYKYRNSYNGITTYNYTEKSYHQAPNETCDYETYRQLILASNGLHFNIKEKHDTTNPLAVSGCDSISCLISKKESVTIF
jgi:ribonucleoside-diphosphate reductase alpha chain